VNFRAPAWRSIVNEHRFDSKGLQWCRQSSHLFRTNTMLLPFASSFSETSNVCSCKTRTKNSDEVFRRPFQTQKCSRSLERRRRGSPYVTNSNMEQDLTNRVRQEMSCRQRELSGVCSIRPIARRSRRGFRAASSLSTTTIILFGYRIDYDSILRCYAIRQHKSQRHRLKCHDIFVEFALWTDGI
jgi:hypothetical protein